MARAHPHSLGRVERRVEAHVADVDLTLSASIIKRAQVAFRICAVQSAEMELAGGGFHLLEEWAVCPHVYIPSFVGGRRWASMGGSIAESLPTSAVGDSYGLTFI